MLVFVVLAYELLGESLRGENALIRLRFLRRDLVSDLMRLL